MGNGERRKEGRMTRRDGGREGREKENLRL